MKFPAPYDSVLGKISKCHRIFKSAKKVISCISPWLWHLVWSWLKSDETFWRSSVSKNMESEILQSAPNDPNQTQGIGHQKYPTYVHCSSPSPKFSSTISRCWDIPNFRFPIDSYIKISKCHIFFLIWGQITNISIISITLYFPMTAVFIIKFGPDQIKTIGVAFCNKNFKVP